MNYLNTSLWVQLQINTHTHKKELPGTAIKANSMEIYIWVWGFVCVSHQRGCSKWDEMVRASKSGRT